MPELTVTLTRENIADIANDMNNDFIRTKQVPPSQDYLEYLICYSIKRKKGVDFFEEQIKENLEIEKEIEEGLRKDTYQDMY